MGPRNLGGKGGSRALQSPTQDDIQAVPPQVRSCLTLVPTLQGHVEPVEGLEQVALEVAAAAVSRRTCRLT